MKDEKEKLQEEIEVAREELDRVMVDFSHKEKYYALSLKLDKLIEDYVDLQVREAL